MNKHFVLRWLSIFVLCALAGCVTTQPMGSANPDDPLEASNRAMFEFNETIDRAVFKPIAEAYAFITPQPIRTCIYNMFLNIGDVWSMFNSAIQGRQVDALNTMGRILLNTTAGLGGCLDLASARGAQRIPNDFGVTLGVWGVSSGPYLVLPIIGSSTLRDGSGKLVDLYVNQVGWGSTVSNVDLRNSLYGLEAVARREALLDVSNVIDRTAIDRYSFIRDAYFKRRSAQVRGPGAEAEALPNYEDFEAEASDKKALGITEKK